MQEDLRRRYVKKSIPIKPEILEALDGFDPKSIERVMFSPALERWVVRIAGDFESKALAKLAQCPLFERGEVRVYSPYALTLYFKNAPGERRGIPRPLDPIVAGEN